MFKKKGNESFLCQVIGNREQADLILHPKKRPYIKGLGEGIRLVKKHRNNHITIIGDYDCDGIGGTVILYHGLRRYGFREGQLSWRIPKRISEGYGLSPKIIDEVGQGLIITVDNGISSIEAIAKARQKGLDVLVIDHHGSHFIATGGSGLKCLGLGLWDKYQQFGSPEEIEVIGYLSENWFKDEMTPQIEIIDFVPFSS